MQKEKYRAFVLLFLAGMLSVHLVLLWNSLDLIRKGYPDFTIFYSGGSILRQGLAHQLYDEATQYRDPRIWTAERDKAMWESLEG